MEMQKLRDRVLPEEQGEEENIISDITINSAETSPAKEITQQADNLLLNDALIDEMQPSTPCGHNDKTQMQSSMPLSSTRVPLLLSSSNHLTKDDIEPLPPIATLSSTSIESSNDVQSLKHRISELEDAYKKLNHVADHYKALHDKFKNSTLRSDFRNIVSKAKYAFDAVELI
jgi:hypothetical protein